ncbi:amidohydrolase family protein [Alteromonas flava]|uniref:amidohydrolase family protein n=1 Tax=Alteromonas flava TaxID=2048003 RepID=UPI0013DB633E|nr:amidohydrolase family protein [Alteromonas flava]
MHTIQKPRKLAFILTVFVSSLVACASFTHPKEVGDLKPFSKYYIINANVLSADGEVFLPNTTLVINNRKIQSVGGKPKIDDHEIIDAQGKYIIPGLIDSHVHLQDSANDLKVYLSYGITYIREMSGSYKHLDWSKQMALGQFGPSIEVSSEKISSKGGIWGFINGLFWNRINITSQQDAIDLIERLKNDGFENAKIASDINKNMYFALTHAAKAKGYKVVGHIPNSVSFEEFIESGQREIAHIEELVKTLNKEFGYYSTDTSEEFLSFVEQKVKTYSKTLSSNNIAVGTTLWYMQSIPRQISDLDSLIQEIDLSFTNPKRLQYWLPDKNEFALKHSNNYEWWTTFVRANEIVLNILLENGVIILAGTDAMTTMVVPGYSLHQELASLVQIGMTPQQAIRSATSIPGDWIGKKVGRIAPGYQADLLILNKNPFDDIMNTQNIYALFKTGNYHPEEELKTRLDSVRNEYAD